MTGSRPPAKSRRIPDAPSGSQPGSAHARRPSGTPSGGQFAPTPKSRASVALEAGPSTRTKTAAPHPKEPSGSGDRAAAMQALVDAHDGDATAALIALADTHGIEIAIPVLGCGSGPLPHAQRA